VGLAGDAASESLEPELEEEASLAASSAVAAGALGSGNFVAAGCALEPGLEEEAPAAPPLPSLDAVFAVAVAESGNFVVAVAAGALGSGNFVAGFSASACVAIGVRGDLGLTSRSALTESSRSAGSALTDSSCFNRPFLLSEGGSGFDGSGWGCRCVGLASGGATLGSISCAGTTSCPRGGGEEVVEAENGACSLGHCHADA